jgi:hypothetical protein
MSTSHIHDPEVQSLIERAEAVRQESRRLVEDFRESVARLRAWIVSTREMRERRPWVPSA